LVRRTTTNPGLLQGSVQTTLAHLLAKKKLALVRGLAQQLGLQHPTAAVAQYHWHVAPRRTANSGTCQLGAFLRCQTHASGSHNPGLLQCL
jgi:diadenosine tetraphosphate (Ap4A) HIT family hydrolase